MTDVTGSMVPVAVTLLRRVVSSTFTVLKLITSSFLSPENIQNAAAAMARRMTNIQILLILFFFISLLLLVCVRWCNAYWTIRGRW